MNKNVPSAECGVRSAEWTAWGCRVENESVMEMLVDAEKVRPSVAAPLIREAGQLTAIVVSSLNTARKSSARS